MIQYSHEQSPLFISTMQNQYQIIRSSCCLTNQLLKKVQSVRKCFFEECNVDYIHSKCVSYFGRDYLGCSYFYTFVKTEECSFQGDNHFYSLYPKINVYYSNLKMTFKLRENARILLLFLLFLHKTFNSVYILFVVLVLLT